MNSGKKQYYDTLRLNEYDRRELLAELDGAQQGADHHDLREDPRLPYQIQGLLVQLNHPGGSRATYLVRPRNISRRGVAFLHGAFCYGGTLCTVLLRDKDSGAYQIDGRIVRCRHLRGMVHEVAIRFDRPIDVNAFVRSCVVSKSDGPAEAMPHFDANVLYIEDAKSDQQLLRFQLSQLGVEVDEAGDFLAANELVSRENYHLLISGMWLPQTDGCEGLKLLREAGYRGPAVMLTSDEDDVVKQKALAAGFDKVLTKPYQLPALLKEIKEYLPPAPDPSAEPLLSELWHNHQMRPLIGHYLNGLDEQVSQIARLIGDVDGRATVRKLATEMRGSAGSYGFPQLSEAAQRLSTEINKTDTDLRNLRQAFNELNGLCKAAVSAVAGKHDRK